MKKRLMLMLAIIMTAGQVLSGCSQGGTSGGTDSTSGSAVTTAAPDSAISLDAGEYRLSLARSEEKYRVRICRGEDELFSSYDPVTLSLVKTSAKQKNIKTGYDSVKPDGESLVCSAELTSDDGAKVLFTDTYTAIKGMFVIKRKVCVAAAGDSYTGFSTSYSVGESENAGVKNYEFFIPSVIYRDSEYMKSGSVMSRLTSGNYVKETRCGTPLAMLRNKKSGAYISLAHIFPEISAGENLYGKSFAVSDSQKYGSIGYELKEKAQVRYIYPSYEAPVTYEGVGVSARYHSLTAGAEQKYTLSITVGTAGLYNDAMVHSYLSVQPLCNVAIPTTEPEKTYAANMELYEKLFLEYKGTGDTFSCGLPFAVNVRDFSKFYAVSFQIGFIGAQTAIASELIREGTVNGNAAALEKGRKILDFWTSDWVYKGAFPPSWWNPSEGTYGGGRSTGYPSFLRTTVDGAEGILNACIYAKAAGIDCSQWEKALKKMGASLVRVQNSDGSFYRAYNVDGSVCTDTSSDAYQGRSKLNTPVAVRFLCNMYRFTGDVKYKNAAMKAADYCYNELYLGIGKYVGGTPDNPNVPDKEASVFALYAFSAIYDLTGDEKYARALEHAAVSAMSWVYTYDFPVTYSLTTEYDSLNIFKNGGTAGWSIIATGHSAIDVFGSNAYYELFRQYVRTGNSAYLTVSRLLENNLRSAMDLSGKREYRYPGFSLEACNTADMIFYTAENGVWLPWISAAFIEPMLRLNDTFGQMSTLTLTKKYDPDTLRKMLNGN